MALIDRLVPLCDLLLGAAYADNVFKDHEHDEVRGLLEDIGGEELSVEIETRLAAFDPNTFDLAGAARHFLADPIDDRKRVLYLVAAINDADDEVDFAEDEYLRALAAALQLPADALTGLTIDVVEDFDQQRETIAKVRRGPPPPPGASRTKSVDIDVD